ncbi:MAG: nucleotide exchange factor GrpE [Candidatus Fermentibacteraceae bacterium]|nr:nucleotide exchange factor GrpE [Candidatus Fermentibacteraceae bacterium]MBN2607548.1 nucleotide exchange factor GrpE [Candidatus Fermentibacteraceae bacterium]
MADPRRTPARRKNGTSSRRRIPVSDRDEHRGEQSSAPEHEEGLQEVSAEEQPVKEGPDPEKLQLRDRLMRLQAEFDNYRKRQARDFRRLCSQGKKDLILELLAVLDNYHRAEKLVKEGGHSVEEIADGLMKTSEQLVGILGQEGLRELEVERDDPFDPNIHEAMLAENTEELDRDTVLEVFQRGYMLDDDLLRPARVKVGKARPRDREERPESEGGE